MATGGTKADKAKADAAAEEARKKREAEEAEEEDEAEDGDDEDADESDEDADESDEDEGEEGEDEDDDEPAEPKPTDKVAAVAAAGGVKSAKPVVPVRPVAPPPVSPAAAQQSGMLKAGSVFVALVVAMGVGFILLGREPANQPAKTYNWKPGQTVDIELTVVAANRENLACASKDEFEGLKCGFTAANEARKPPIANNDKLLLKPYTLADNSLQITAAGLWAEPILAGTLPITRFTVKCKYTVKGTVKTPGVRWEASGPWYPQQRDWYAGAVSNCTLGTTG